MPHPVTIVVDLHGAAGAEARRAVESACAQGAQEVVAIGEAEQAPALEGLEVGAALGEATPAQARNAAVAGAAAEAVLVLGGHEWLAPDAVARLAAALGSDADAGAAYGKTGVHRTNDRLRVFPDAGREDSMFGHLLRDKHLVAASGALLWRRDAAPPTPYADYCTLPALRLAHVLEVGRTGRRFAFVDDVVVERAVEALDAAAQEELIKVVVAVLFGAEPLDEELEARARFRLARHLVALGKLRYRAEDYDRAGRLFDEALRSAPGYFKGRRYQFMNFVQRTLARVD